MMDLDRKIPETVMEDSALAFDDQKFETHEEGADDEEDEEPKPWDEGGPSDCGYHETIHDALMSVGESVHSIVGDPDESVKNSLGAVGNWFQEASYAVRDIIRGENSEDMQEDASQAISTIMNGGEDKKEESAP
jgi:hypothetical protein